MTSKGYKGGIDFEKEYQEKIERESKELANKVNVEYERKNNELVKRLEVVSKEYDKQFN